MESCRIGTDPAHVSVPIFRQYNAKTAPCPAGSGEGMAEWKPRLGRWRTEHGKREEQHACVCHGNSQARTPVRFVVTTNRYTRRTDRSQWCSLLLQFLPLT